ncbi:MAG: hypothetical protein ABSA11_14320 [Candidatus Bathyarchaeia archaeon]|jgi:hypothetical protein
MRLESDENTLRRLIIITIIIFIVTVCAVTSFSLPAHAQLAPASNSTTAAQTGSFPALTASKPVSNATEPSVQPQLSLSYVNFRDDIFIAGEPITMRVGPIRSNQTGVYSATAVITAQIGGVESSYESIVSYSRDSNWFTFNFVLGEAGNYSITVW